MHCKLRKIQQLFCSLWDELNSSVRVAGHEVPTDQYHRSAHDTLTTANCLRMLKFGRMWCQGDPCIGWYLELILFWRYFAISLIYSFHWIILELYYLVCLIKSLSGLRGFNRGCFVLVIMIANFRNEVGGGWTQVISLVLILSHFVVSALSFPMIWLHCHICALQTDVEGYLQPHFVHVRLWRQQQVAASTGCIPHSHDSMLITYPTLLKGSQLLHPNSAMWHNIPKSRIKKMAENTRQSLSLPSIIQPQFNSLVHNVSQSKL